MTNTDFTLAIEDLTVSFDGFKAVDSLNLYIDKDELRVVIGPNGAGKTTVLDLICGKTKSTSGSIKFKNHELTELAEQDWLSVRNNKQIDARIREVADDIFLGEFLDMESALLSHGQKQWLEIGMLLIQDPELLMLDEPVAGMSVKEREQTAELLNRICKGRSVLVIEHDMDFVEKIAHKVTVLHQGRILAEGDMQSVQNNPEVIEVYLGH